MKTTETLIVRSHVAKSLYDVVEVNYVNETLNVIEKSVSFEDAQVIVAEHAFFEDEFV